MTSRPCAAIDTARFAETVVLPTPPLPPVTAMTLTGRDALRSARAWARSGVSLKSRMSSHPAESTRQRSFIACARRTLLELQRRANQRYSFLMRRVQVLRHSLTVAHVRD